MDCEKSKVHKKIPRCQDNSYSEIVFESPYCDKREELNLKNDMEDMIADSSDDEKSSDEKYKPQSLAELQGTERPKSLVCEEAFPYSLESTGTISKLGNMTHFVAENIQFKIKNSSPNNIKKDNNSAEPSISKNSTPSTSTTGLPHQFLSSSYLPQIDSNVLNDIEIEAQYLAASVDILSENLCNLLHSISSITADNVEIHKNSVSKLTDNMDANIKCMYTIMAKTEEISKSMKPTDTLAQKIREIKRLVDMLDNV